MEKGGNEKAPRTLGKSAAGRGDTESEPPGPKRRKERVGKVAERSDGDSEDERTPSLYTTLSTMNDTLVALSKKVERLEKAEKMTTESGGAEQGMCLRHENNGVRV